MRMTLPAPIFIWAKESPEVEIMELNSTAVSADGLAMVSLFPVLILAEPEITLSIVAGVGVGAGEGTIWEIGGIWEEEIKNFQMAIPPAVKSRRKKRRAIKFFTDDLQPN